MRPAAPPASRIPDSSGCSTWAPTRDVAFVVEEPLTGAVPLSHLLQRGGLPAEEVRRLTGETASALDKASHRGLHHLALTPSVDPAHARRRRQGAWPRHRGRARPTPTQSSDEQASRVDAVGLVKLIVCRPHRPLARGAVGRGWARARPVGLEPAPTMVGGVAAPSEIAVGMPNDLDLICRMTLNEDRGPMSPGDLALQIAPWPSEPPTSDGATGIRLPAQPSDITPTGGSPALAPRYGPADAGTSGDLYARLAGRRGIQGAGADTGGAANGAGAAASSACRCRLAPQPRLARVSPVAARQQVNPSSPPVRPPASRAPWGTGSAPSPEPLPTRQRHEPPNAGSDDARPAFDGEDIAIDRSPRGRLLRRRSPRPWSSGGTPERPTGAQSRIALAIVGVLVLVALFIGINNVAKIGESDGPAEARPTVTVTRTRATPAPSATTQQAPAPTTPATRAPDGQPVTIVGGTSFDPQDDGEESRPEVKIAFDGDSGTAWRSRWYGSDTYNGARRGSASCSTSAPPRRSSEVELVLPAAQDVTVYLADEASPRSRAPRRSARSRDTSGTVDHQGPRRSRPAAKVIVVVTRPAPAEAPNHYRAQIRRSDGALSRGPAAARPAR